MCSISSKICPQDNSIVTGTVSTGCFPKGSQDLGRLYTFKTSQDFLNPGLMRSVFNVENGSSYYCSDPKFTMKLPSNQEELNQQVLELECQTGVKGWILKSGCIGNNPPSNPKIIDKCCSELNTNSGICPKGYCPNSSICNQIITQKCIENGLNDEYCQSYFKNSQDQSGLKTTTNKILNTIVQSGPCSGDLQNNPCSSQIYQLCKKSPYGSCDEFLFDKCKKYTRDEISLDPQLSKLCGCHLSAEQYNKYKQLQVPGGIIQKECDPLCSNVDAIQVGVECNPNKCSQAVCIMDFSTQNVKQMIQDGVNLDQNCVGKPNQGNVCVFSLNVNGANILKEKNINVSQNCGSCAIYDPNRPELGISNIDCKNLNSSINNFFQNIPTPTSSNIVVYILFSITIILAFIIIGIFLYKMFKNVK